MTDAMRDASSEAGHGIPAVSAVDPWTLLKKAFGVDTQEEVAARAGLSLRTLQRMIERPERSLLGNALQIRARTGLSLDQIIPAASSELGEAA
ncbi:hypothetical protein [Micromonospora sp. NPDC000018]|uniref:hypothetical protein n=1 Tax=Micromonospora sp. NPDC000018 TaxID=3154239 RepID=UPI003326D283